MALRHPEVHFVPIIGNFLQSIDLRHIKRDFHRLGILLGATLGNLSTKEVIEFLNGAQRTLGSEAALIVSMDILKSPEFHLRAYMNDTTGIRRAFCDNLIRRINRVTGANIQPENFSYAPIWNPTNYAVEMSYISRFRQQIEVAGGRYQIEPAERIIIKRSHKYPLRHAVELFAKAHYGVEKIWTTPHGPCQLFYLKPFRQIARDPGNVDGFNQDECCSK